MLDIPSILNTVGSVFKQDFDTKKEKELLYEELRTIADLKERLAGPVWEKLFDRWKVQAEIYESDIVRLSKNVKKNADEIQWKSAIRCALVDLIEVVEEALAEEPTIISKLRNIEEITREQEAAQATPQ